MKNPVPLAIELPPATGLEFTTPSLTIASITAAPYTNNCFCIRFITCGVRGSLTSDQAQPLAAALATAIVAA